MTDEKWIKRFDQRTKIALDPLLGQVPDRVLAEKYQVSASKIYTIRRRLDIPASHKHLCPTDSNRKITLATLLHEVVPLLGLMTDRELARRYGVSAERIRQYRKEFKVPKFTRPVRPRTSVLLTDGRQAA